MQVIHRKAWGLDWVPKSHMCYVLKYMIGQLCCPLMTPAASVLGNMVQSNTCSLRSTQLVASTSTCLFTDLHSDSPSGSDVLCSLYL